MKKNLALRFRELIKFLIPYVAAIAILDGGTTLVSAQTALTFVPLGQCQMTSLGSATFITAANCTRASFTASGSGTQLTTSSVTGRIQIGDQLAGTGVPTGTFIASQISGTPNGAGVYTTNNVTTSSSASLTSGGIPNGATLMVVAVEGAAVRYRDDLQAPTASVGEPLSSGQAFTYQSTIANWEVIQQTSSATLDLSFYR
jgi:hypothetical protein